MRDALTSISEGEGQQVIIVDDITTSGATLQAAAEALGKAGWSVRGAAVVADAQPGLGVAPTAVKG
jgi:adenine/guanine phosphoribosyltransferase-like PRPP-binding protein